LLVAVLLTSGLVVLTTSTPAMAVRNFDAGAIADQALARLGQYGGQCKQFANDMALAGSGGLVHLGGGYYYSDYSREGGVMVGSASAGKGDIIQLNGANVDTYYPGMHTAIIAQNLGNNQFDVVDSNWGSPANNQIVHRHNWNPYVTASASHLSVNIWRLGNTPSGGSSGGDPNANRAIVQDPS